MTVFLRLLAEDDKAQALLVACTRLRQGEVDPRLFEVRPESFDAVPGKPFAYWVSDAVRVTFLRLPAFEGEGRTVKQGLATADDFRFVRAWWEPGSAGVPPAGGQDGRAPRWFPFAKGGAYSPFYADVYLVVKWGKDGGEIKNNLNEKGGVRSNVWMLRDTANNFFLRPGLTTWPLRTQSGLSLRALPAGCIFGHKGPAAFVADDNPDELLALLALTNSRAFGLLVSLQMAFGSYEVGVIQKTPIPPLNTDHRPLTTLAKRAWSLKRTLDTIKETSHAFLLPAALRSLTPLPLEMGFFSPLPTGEGPGERAPPSRRNWRVSRPRSTRSRLTSMALPRPAGKQWSVISGRWPVKTRTLTTKTPRPTKGHRALTTDHLLSWAVGVAFGRFDWRLATGERQAPPEPDPFDPLPAKSPGMLPDGAEAFHAHAGILVDDQGHPHDLARLVEEVLDAVAGGQWPVTGGHWPPITDTRRWLRRDFFPFHLQRYSKSRRKAPIYWPLSTASGSYTLWVYYPNLSSQTLYTAINDFVEPKLSQVGADVATLRNKGTARTRDDEKQFEAQQAFELELIELRDTLLKLAPTYKPNHDDGVQISAAPLWPLFRHKSWQKVLKDTWAKLEKGDYDWAHLAMNYWPARVRDKCKTDKSLAIAHDIEDLYIETEAKSKKARGRKSKED
ncbi:MAG: hypothetical protein PHE55_14220 [Methylococcaceae bacterium]|nr:hypothetical protein [Methylococcaceae bacterium]